MLDMNVAVKNTLSALAGGRIELQFPETTAAFPMISIFCVSNQSQLVFNGIERLSFVSYQIDEWDTAANGNIRQQCEQLAIDVSTAMLAAGWKRDISRPMDDPSGLHRVMQQYSGYVDNVTGKIYPTNHIRS